VTPAEAADRHVALTGGELLDLERVAEDRFRNKHNQDNFQGFIFGGQPLAQALAAAQRTVPGWLPHSCTGYFLSGGRITAPVDYQVERVRSGRRFTARRVLALQGAKPIFDLLCSFHDVEEGHVHQMGNTLDVPAPESLLTVLEFVRAHANRLPAEVVDRHERFHRAFPVELRLAEPEKIFFGEADHAARVYWFRMPSAHTITDQAAQRCLLSFMSDYWFAGAAGAPHRSPASVSSDLFVASLNHSLWFHAPVRVDEWLLYRTESPWAGEGRGMARGLIYDRSGRLVASAVQEASLRIQQQKADA